MASLLGGGLFGIRLSSTFNSLAKSFSNAEVIQQFAEYFKINLITKEQTIELVAGYIMLFLFSIHMITAEKAASVLFMPADVNILFASDRTPQQNLVFRILSTIGTSVIATLYLTFQMPNITTRLGITNFAG